MYTTASTEKKLAAYRISPLTIERLKAKAKSDNVSVNTLVEMALTDLVKDVKTDAEIQEERNKTKNFLDSCVGIWEGEEYDEVEKFIKGGRTIKPIVEL